MQVFNGRTADDAWWQAIELFRNAAVGSRNGRGGATSEVLHAAFSIDEPCNRWILSRTPPLNPAFALAEVIWIVNGENRSDVLNFWNPKLPQFAGTTSTYHGAYGYRIRRSLQFDQLERACDALTAQPDSRQVVLQIWDGRIDMPTTKGEPAAADVPCNVVSTLKIRDGRLHWMQVMRSNDLVIGFPHNVVQFTSLQEILAGWLDVRVGAYTHVSDSLHVYERDWPSVTASSRVTIPNNSCGLALPRKESEAVLAELYSRMLDMATGILDERAFIAAADGDGMPTGYRDMLAVLSADAARRRGWCDLAADLTMRCSNPALRLALERWFARRQKETATD